jgi:pimeloyl-ACP methyl ester carboxylesterase
MLALSAASSAQSPTPPTLSLSACRLEHPSRVLAVAAECGRLRVPENSAEPAGRQIEIFVARVRAINLRKAPDPLFLIAGGPGGSTADMYTMMSSAFDRVRRDRDIVLVDQRGTGKSHKLRCDIGDENLLDVDPDFDIVAVTRQCRDELAQQSDLRQYTTSVAVRDLDAVRRALGYERINIYGVSYGTRVAQHYARRFPDATRALILDGVIAPENVLGPQIAIDAEHALERILARCTKDASCAKAFPDPLGDYRALRAGLAKLPVQVSVPDGAGKAQSFEFTTRHLSVVLRLSSYSDDQAALLPLSLHLARHDGNYLPLANQFRVITRSLSEGIANGMHNSVMCSEDAPLIDGAKVDRAALEATHMTAEQLDQIGKSCAEWPKGPVDADLHAPLVSQVPALLLSGSDDPVTPPPYAAAAAKAFSDQLHIVFAGRGHGQAAAPCVDRVMLSFINAASARNLDVACVARLAPMPFFTTLSGPAP